jgi:hypothetical protein
MYLPHKNFIQVMIYLLKDVKIWMRNHLLESQMSKLLQAPWPIIYILISWIFILPNQSLACTFLIETLVRLNDTNNLHIALDDNIEHKLLCIQWNVTQSK